ncbi:MAG: gfo/Idh/MocA family oxidoreductase [Planctomycetota bacterium]|nr:MAG: gfo/Idh/MocA family oxidoreductase [Planctomycetota bacterium]
MKASSTKQIPGWGIVGPGQIAKVFAESLQRWQVGRLLRVQGRSLERSRHFCAEHGGSAVADLETLVQDPEVAAVYVATPHSHHGWAVQAALQAGKAVLCEKPMSVCPQQSRDLVNLAADLGLPLVEAWMYRCHPQIAQARRWVEEGRIGRLQRLEASFGFHAPFQADHRLFAPELGGGAILDIGGYPLSLAMYFAPCAGDTQRPYAEPESMQASGRLTSTGVEAFATAQVQFDGGFEARITASIDGELGRRAVLIGDRGRLHFEDPFMPEGRRLGLIGRLNLETDSGTQETEVEAPMDCFALEAAAMAGMLADDPVNLQPPPPMIGSAETLALADGLLRWRQQVGAVDLQPAAVESSEEAC